MIDLLLTLLAFGSVYLCLSLFGYYSALGHVDRLLDIEEPEGRPEHLQSAKRALLAEKALSPEDIDRIDEWEDWKE